MPRYTGIGMPKKRKRAVAEWSEAQDAVMNENSQESAVGATSASTSRLHLDEDNYDLLAVERAEAESQYGMLLEVAQEQMAAARAKLQLAQRLYKAKVKRLAGSAIPSPVRWLERYNEAKITWYEANAKYWAGKEVVAELREKAKNLKIRFLERENARLRRLVPRV